LSSAEEAVVVAALCELADGRGGLLAEAAGVLGSAHDGELDEPLPRQAAWLGAGLPRPIRF